ncbi:Hypothetical predicted protein [Pelobates cultripes]|uniref:Uncharacterized protein n=1 Tax=Pelobates cultripes TaxID=61616 RepID=A0AAD1SGT4_PELCU|nr:Hypothetical predicted protein [Pelobates cultripes]
MRPEMVTHSDGPYRCSSEASFADIGELELPAIRRNATVSPMKTAEQLVTEGTLKTLLGDLSRNIAADINAFKKEISGVSVCLHDTELATTVHEIRLTNLDSELTRLKHEQSQILNCMAAMEDHRHWKKY